MITFSLEITFADKITFSHQTTFSHKINYIGQKRGPNSTKSPLKGTQLVSVLIHAIQQGQRYNEFIFNQNLGTFMTATTSLWKMASGLAQTRQMTSYING